jgi:hypothetical protein
VLAVASASAADDEIVSEAAETLQREASRERTLLRACYSVGALAVEEGLGRHVGPVVRAQQSRSCPEVHKPYWAEGS